MKYIILAFLLMPLSSYAAPVDYDHPSPLAGLFDEYPFSHGMTTSHQASKGVSTSHSKVFIEAQSSVPIPSAIILLGSGLIGLVLVGRRNDHS